MKSLNNNNDKCLSETAVHSFTDSASKISPLAIFTKALNSCYFNINVVICPCPASLMNDSERLVSMLTINTAHQSNIR